MQNYIALFSGETVKAVKESEWGEVVSLRPQLSVTITARNVQNGLMSVLPHNMVVTFIDLYINHLLSNAPVDYMASTINFIQHSFYTSISTSFVILV